MPGQCRTKGALLASVNGLLCQGRRWSKEWQHLASLACCFQQRCQDFSIGCRRGKGATYVGLFEGFIPREVFFQTASTQLDESLRGFRRRKHPNHPVFWFVHGMRNIQCSCKYEFAELQDLCVCVSLCVPVSLENDALVGHLWPGPLFSWCSQNGKRGTFVHSGPGTHMLRGRVRGKG